MKKLLDQSAPLFEDERKIWLLRLYIAGKTPNSIAAISNLKKVCEECLAGRYEIEIIDLQEHPQIAREAQILATPTLLRVLPSPLRKLIGNLSSEGIKAELEIIDLEKTPVQSTPLVESGGKKEWLLRLYVAGQSPKSITAIFNLKKICEGYLAGRYKIEVIDLLENPHLASEEQILAIPTLLRILPAPMRKLIGDLSNTERTLIGLDLQPKND